MNIVITFYPYEFNINQYKDQYLNKKAETNGFFQFYLNEGKISCSKINEGK